MEITTSTEIEKINKEKMSIRNIVFNSSLVIFFFAVLMWIYFDPYQFSYQQVVSVKLMDSYFHLGIDGLSLFFIYLTAFLVPLCILFNWNNKTITNTYSMIFLISIEILLIFVFSVVDLLLFYIFFEATLIPFFMFIGINGYRNRRIHAAYLLFFYTLFGSLLMLISIFSIYLHCGTTDIQVLWEAEFSTGREHLFWLFFFIAFAIKVPIFPFHIWLPEAHVEAPTEGSVILAGVLLKLGTYGILRFLFTLFSNATVYYSPLVLLLSCLAIFYTSFTTLRQIDIKRIVAYSSVAHMNMCILGLFTFDPVAIVGSILLMVGHGLVSGGLFFLIGVLYNRYHTKLIKYYSGLVQFMPIFSFFFFLFIMGNMSMPGTSNFIGEFLILCGIFTKKNIYGVFVASLGILIGTIYSIWLYNKITFGLHNTLTQSYLKDMTLAEVLLFIPILVHIVWIGVYPESFISIIISSLLPIYELIM